jgi:predicted acylesterase/phospholipase RssA
METNYSSRFQGKDNCQENLVWKPEIVVLGPGGIKGFMELGSLYRLMWTDLLSEVHTYVGVSVGSIISLLMICGYSPIDIVSDALEMDIFEDISKFTWANIQDNLVNIQKNIGIISTEPIRRKLNSKVQNKFGRILTLQELYEVTGKTFVSVSANLDKEQTEYISHLTEPELKCVDAVMLSMNIPIIFYKLKHKECVYVDGALGNPYPVDIFDDGTNKILGIYTKSTKKTNQEPQDATTIMYIHKIIHFSMTTMRDRIIQTASKNCKHIELEAKIMDSIGLTIDTKIKAEMFMKGLKITDDFIKENHLERYTIT